MIARLPLKAQVGLWPVPDLPEGADDVPSRGRAGNLHPRTDRLLVTRSRLNQN